MKDLKFDTVAELLQWLHEQRDAGIEFPAHRGVGFHVFSRALVGGGVECNLWYGPGIQEADMKFQEETPGALTVAVVTHGGARIDYTEREPFPGTAKLDELRKTFPHGRNIDKIMAALLREG